MVDVTISQNTREIFLQIWLDLVRHIRLISLFYNMCYVTFQISSLENYTSTEMTQHETTRDNTRQHKYNTAKHKITQDNTSTKRDNMSNKQRKIYLDLFISSLYTRIPIN